MFRPWYVRLSDHGLRRHEAQADLHQLINVPALGPGYVDLSMIILCGLNLKGVLCNYEAASKSQDAWMHPWLEMHCFYLWSGFRQIWDNI